MKALEKVWAWRLEESELIQNPLTCDQHAFRRGCSTDSALSTMAEYAESAIIQNKFALGIFLDIQGAFDNVSIDADIKGMQDKKFPEVFINWYRSYLEYRTVIVSCAKNHDIERRRAVVKLPRAREKEREEDTVCSIVHNIFSRDVISEIHTRETQVSYVTMVACG